MSIGLSKMARCDGRGLPVAYQNTTLPSSKVALIKMSGFSLTWCALHRAGARATSFFSTWRSARTCTEGCSRRQARHGRGHQVERRPRQRPDHHRHALHMSQQDEVVCQHVDATDVSGIIATCSHTATSLKLVDYQKKVLVRLQQHLREYVNVDNMLAQASTKKCSRMLQMWKRSSGLAL